MMPVRIIDAVVCAISSTIRRGAWLALFAAVWSVTAQAQISGAVTSDTTWTFASSPVNVSGDVVVLAGRTLAIEPGVRVRFAAGTGLTIEGKLVAQGTVSDTIVFTSAQALPARGDWDGLEFVNSANVGSVVHYARVEWVGSGAGQAGIFYRTGAYGVPLANIHLRESSGEGVNLRASSPTITDSRFESMDGYGVFSDLYSNFILRRSVVEWCTEGGVRIPLNAAPTVDTCIIIHNGYGIYIDNGASPTIAADTIRYNATGIYHRSVGGVQPTIRNNVISSNTEWGINAEGTIVLNARRNYWGSEYGPFSEQINPSGRGNKVSVKVEVSPWRSSGTLPVTNVTSTIASNTTWTAGVYWVKNSITVNGGVTLTLRPGVIVKMAPSTYLSVTGFLAVQSTYDSLVVFTSEKDDSYGGDSNGDGDVTAPAAGNWGYVYLANSTSLANMIVKYGSHNIYLSNTASLSYIYSSVGNSYNVFGDGGATSVTITDCYFTGSNSVGVYLAGVNGAVVSVDRSKFLRNNGHGLYLVNGSMTMLDSSEANDNGQFGVYTSQENAATAQSFTWNKFVNNGQVGLSVGSVKSSPISINDNVFDGNGQEGLLSSKATIQNNSFIGNRVPLALQLNVGSTYAGNVFTGNAYNNVIGLRSIYSSPSNLKGTLSLTTPAGLAAGVYLLMESEDVRTGDTLLIEPGVIVKGMASTNLSVDGTLIADGTPASPIVFTSYRDHSVGGKVNLVADTLAPAVNNWSGLYVSSNPVTTMLDNVKIFYATYGLYTSGNWNNQISYVTVEHNQYATYISTGVVVLESPIARYNTYGITGLNTVDMTIRNAVASYNTYYGIQYYPTYSTPVGGLRELSNSQVIGNGYAGVFVEPAQIPQVYVGNTISSNGRYGVWNNNLNQPATDVQFIGNTVSNNVWEGIVSSRSRFVDNTFSGNRHGIGMMGNLGHIYTDNTGTDNNQFSGNRRPAIAVFASGWGSVSVTDTLQRSFPAGITTGVYNVMTDLSLGGDTLVIAPGVIVKFASGTSINAGGHLVAIGTAADKIVFTSYRDHSFGGKTNEPTDTLKAGNSDWTYIYFNGTGNATTSRVEHVDLRYSYYGLYVVNQLVYPMRYVNVKYCQLSGVYVTGDVDLAIHRLTADSCTYYGVKAQNDASVSLDSSIVRWNDMGLYGDYTYGGVGSGRFASVTNSLIGWNRNDGVRVLLGQEPQVFQYNRIVGNARHGVWNYSQSTVYDTLLLMTGNTIASNGETGVLSTRAYFVDDSLLNNKYPLGVTGELSKAGTGTADGNFYAGNVLLGNTYNHVITVYDNVWGKLGGTRPVDTAQFVHRLESAPTVPAGKLLVVAPGTVVKSAASQSLNVNGAFTSLGTSTQRITFTSWKDDTFGGDTNKDSTASTPAPGDWSYILLSAGAGGDAKSFRFTNVRFATYGLYVSGTTDGIVVDSSFISNNSQGMYRPGAATVTITGTDIHSNSYGINNSGAGTLSVTSGNIYNNTSYGIYHSSTANVAVTNNYWGAATGPLVQTGPDLNPTGTGNKIQNASSGYAIYRPFLTARGGILAGDVSQNGTISAFDASLVLQHVVGSIVLTSPQQVAADVTANGEISALDASFVLRYVVGIVTGFPGLGKTTGVTTAPGTALAVRSNGTEIEAVVRLKASGIYATQFTLSYDTLALRPLEVLKTSLSDSMQMASHSTGNEVRVALAGTQPLSRDGEWVIVRFEALRPTAGSAASLVHISSFLLNEANIATSAEDQSGLQTPTSFDLGQNYPNPFNPSTTVRFQLPAASRVTLKIFDVLGREVATLVQSDLPAGYHQTVWNGADDSGARVSSGMYLLTMQAQPVDGQPFRSVRKMILTK